MVSKKTAHLSWTDFILNFHHYFLGQFSSANLVFQLVSVMGLLTLTATVIDVIALYIIPNKDSYRQYVFDESPEFSEHAKQALKELVDDEQSKKDQ